MAVMASQINANRLFVQQIVKGNSRGHVKTPHDWAFVMGIRRRPVDSPHKWPVTRNAFPWYDVFMCSIINTGRWCTLKTHSDRVRYICVSKLTTIPIMACHLVSANHYLTQCWYIVNSNLTNKLLWNLKRNSYIFIHENAFQSRPCRLRNAAKHDWNRTKIIFVFPMNLKSINGVICQNVQTYGPVWLYILRKVLRQYGYELINSL